MEDVKEITPEENMPIEAAPPTGRDRVLKHLADQFPDKQYGEGDDLLEDLANAMDEHMAYKERNASVNQKLIDMFEAEPVLYQIITDALQGAPGMVAIARNITPEELQAAMDDQSNEEWDKNLGSRQERLDKSRAAQSEAEANLQESMAEAEAFAAEMEMTPEETDQFLQAVDEELALVFKGKITKSFLGKVYKGMNYDEHLKEQRQLGEIAGRNQKIVAEKEVNTDNLPKVKGNSTPVEEKAPAKENYIDRINKRPTR